MKILEMKKWTIESSEPCDIMELDKRKDGVYVTCFTDPEVPYLVTFKIDPEELVIDEDDDDAMYSFFYELINTLITNRDEFEITDEEFETVVKNLEQDMKRHTDDISKYDDFDDEIVEDKDVEDDDEEDEEDDNPPVDFDNSILLMTGDRFGFNQDAVNWDEFTGENLLKLQHDLELIHTNLINMYAGRINPGEIIDDATNIINNQLGFPDNYIFPMAKPDISDRELALIKMFDVHAMYFKLYKNAAVRDEKAQTQQTMDSFSQEILKVMMEASAAENDDKYDVSDVIEAAEDIRNEEVGDL